MSSVPDPAKLKVVELRSELSSRGLDTKGNKAVLVKRLKDALESELKTELPDTSVVDTSTEDANTSQNEDEAGPDKKDDSEMAEDVKDIKDDGDKETDNVTNAESVSEEPSKKPETEDKEVAQSETVASQDEEMKMDEGKPDEEKQTSEAKEDDDKPEDAKQEENGEQQDNAEEPPSKKQKVEGGESESTAAKNESGGEKDAQQRKDEEDHQSGEKRKRSNESKQRPRTPIVENEPPIDSNKVQLNWYDSDLHLQIDKETFLKAKPYHDGIFGYVWSGVRASHGANTGKVCFEVKVTEELKWEDVIKQPEKGNRDRDRRDSRRDKSRNRDSKRSSDAKKDKNNEENGSEQKVTEEKHNEDNPSNAEKALESKEASETEENKQSTQESATDETNVEKKESPDEQSKDETEKMDCEKDVESKGEGQEEEEEKDETKEEKVGDEDKDEKMETEESSKPEESKDAKEEQRKIPTHLIRIGWSVSSESLQLGESKFSYGFESSGKFVSDKQFTEYGKAFGVGDVIGTFLAFSDESVNIIYTINGEELPLAVSIPTADLPEQDFSLFPHILSKNYVFEVNFGDLEEPLCKIPEKLSEYKFISTVEEKVLGPQRPETRSDCEVIMMIGLPASGKTHWVNEYVEKNKDKRYTIIGNSQLLDKMTVDGTPIRNSIKPYWSALVDKLTKTSNKLVDVASARRRNIVIDQTNDFHNTQRRKMRQFEGYKRKAVVVVCGEEEQAKRKAQYEEQQDTKLSNAYLCQMKANMSLPRVGEWLEEVTYVELKEDEAKAMVQKYNKEGKDAGYGNWPRREARNNRFNKWQDNRRNDYHGGFRSKYPPAHRYDRGPKQDYRSQRWSSNDRRNNRDQSRDWRSQRGSSQRQQDRSRDRHRSGNRDNYSRNRHQGGGAWQGGSSGSGSGGNWSRGSWNQGNNQWSPGGNWGNGSWNSNQGDGKWSYSHGGQYGQPHGYGNGNYSAWNSYYGGGQNWSSNHGSSSMSGNGH